MFLKPKNQIEHNSFLYEITSYIASEKVPVSQQITFNIFVL